MKQVPLSRGLFALVDDEDFERVMQHNWFIALKPNGMMYAVRELNQNKGARRSIQRMHRFVLSLSGPLPIVDHRNHNGLDNQKRNLRRCTQQNNVRNRRKGSAKKTSKFKGVCWSKANKKWRANIRFDNKQVHIGLYQSEKDAALAYNAAANKYYGDFACLNQLGEYR